MPGERSGCSLDVLGPASLSSGVSYAIVYPPKTHMKTTRTVFLLACIIGLGGFAVTRSRAQHSNSAQPEVQVGPIPDRALRQLGRYLADNLDPNERDKTLKVISHHIASLQAKESLYELGATSSLLLRLREGRTNEAIKLLEDQLNLSAVALATSYEALSPELRAELRLESLEQARAYYDKFPRNRSRAFDDAVARSFALADKASSTQKEQTAKLVRLGKAQYESGELDAAANTLLDCLRADPQNAPAQYYLNLVREAELLKSLKQRDIGGDFWYPTIPPRRIR